LTTASAGAAVEEAPLGRIPWLIVHGPRAEAFHALGAHAADEIRSVVAEIPDLPRLRSRLATEAAAAQLHAVSEASRTGHPHAWSDLEALAAGANVDFSDLLLLNLRGDLGTPGGGGCSDLAWTNGDQAFIAHNEDDYPVLADHCRLLTLDVEGETAVVSWWTPGFLPANTWALTEAGLIYTIDHLNVVRPGRAAGRHFVAREMQRSKTVEDAVDWLRSRPSAGGFTYTLGRIGTADITVAETAAGKCSTVDVVPKAKPRWHTNHVRYLPAGVDAPLSESRARGDILARATCPATPDPDWFTTVLTTPPPRGVHRDAVDGDPLATNCTVVVDLSSGALRLTTPHDSVTTSASELLTRPKHQQTGEEML
jgi:hypothetical protein